MLQIEVKQSFRVQSFAASSKSFTLKGGARHRFINRELQSALSPRVLRAYSNALNTRSNDFIRRYIERVTSRKRNNRFGSRCEG